MKHKWLEEIGIHSYPDNHFGGCKNIGDLIRNIKYRIRKHKTGVDVRDCWDLDTWYYEWLYEHLMQYKQDAGEIIDLAYYKFMYKDKEYTEIELINILCDKLKEIMKWDEYDGMPEMNLDIDKDMKSHMVDFTDNDREEARKVLEKNIAKKNELKTEIFDIWKLIVDAVWW